MTDIGKVSRLNPEDIIAHKFSVTRFREGYDMDEVDDFLDEVLVEFRTIVKENAEMREKLASHAEEAVPPSDQDRLNWR